MATTINNNDDDLFSINIADTLTANNRKATRYVRDDISASITYQSMFGRNKQIPVELLDITSKGVLISTLQKLSMNKKINLSLLFKTGKCFDIKAKIVRHSISSQNEYGIQFDRYNNELGDYLFETQDKLIFK